MTEQQPGAPGDGPQEQPPQEADDGYDWTVPDSDDDLSQPPELTRQ